MPQELILLIIGFLAGILSGMFGIGGGVVIVPALIGILAYTFVQATSTSLAALLLPVGIFAVISYHRKGFVSLRTALLICFGLFLGSWFGASLALGLDKVTLQRFYGIFLLYVFWRFTEPLKWYAEIRNASKTGEKPKEPEAAAEIQAAWFLILGIGIIAGVMSGMFGIGGGLVIVPALVTFFKYDQKRAVGTSLAALLLPGALPAVLAYYQAGELNIAAAFFVALGLLFGAFAGAKIALGLPSTTIKRLYGIFLLFIAIRFMFPELFIPPN